MVLRGTLKDLISISRFAISLKKESRSRYILSLKWRENLVLGSIEYNSIILKLFNYQNDVVVQLSYPMALSQLIILSNK